jgi:hypothetical protein
MPITLMVIASITSIIITRAMGLLGLPLPISIFPTSLEMIYGLASKTFLSETVL